MKLKKAVKGTKTLGICVKTSMAEEIEKRANKMGISTSMYCKSIMTNWIQSGNKMSISE